MLLRLRSPIFDHGALGIPVRKMSSRRGTTNAREDQELVEFREMANALLELKDPSNKEEWRAVAKAHIGWQPVEADLHLELFETMFQVETIQRIPDVLEDARTARKLRFALFLFIQLYELHRPRRTSSMDLFNIHSVPEKVAPGSTSPTQQGSASDSDVQPEDNDPRHLILESRKREWSHRLAFVKRRIGDFIATLCQLVQPNLTIEPSTSVSPKVLDALGFLVAGSDKSGERASRLSQAFSELKEDVTVARVTAFLLERLVADETRNPQWSSFDMSKAWTTVSSLSPVQKGAPTLIRGAGQQELVVVPPPSSRTFTHQDFRSATIVAASHGANIVCLAAGTYAHIIGCSDCVIFLGPVVGVLTVEHCERVRIHAACGHVRLVNCVDIKLNIWTGNRPILLGDCRAVVAGPFDVRYPNCAKHCQVVCSSEKMLSTEYQAWRHPVLTDAGGVDEEEMESAVFSIQAPEDLFIEPVTSALPPEFPLASFLPDDLKPPPLPAEYAAKLNDRKTQIQSNMQLIKETIQSVKASKGSQAGFAAKSDMNSALQSAFRDWLESSGKLNSLMPGFLTTSPPSFLGGTANTSGASENSTSPLQSSAHLQ